MTNNTSRLGWVVGAGIVGADIGTSVFYSTGFLFPYVGYLAPLFILFVCLMMWVFMRTYEEGISMSPFNGGAYVMILRSIGRRMAVFAGGLTFVSYLATAAVSALAGAKYLSSGSFLFPDGLDSWTIVFLAFLPIIIFGLLNTKGIKEPAQIVTWIAGLHFALLLIMGAWGLGYVLFVGVDFSKMANIHPDSHITGAMILHGFAAAFLGITGFESAAQIVEELKEPLQETVHKLYKTVVILVSLTAPLISFLCLAVLTEEEVITNREFLLSGLGQKLGGSTLLGIVIFDATLTLFAAVNTAFVGFIGLTTTMAKQGNLPKIFLYRINHKFPSIQGYPMAAIPFMAIAMLMVLYVAGKGGILEEVYGMAFLGVMVSFCIGVVLMRNRRIRGDIDRKYLTTKIITIKGFKVPIGPAFASLLLLFAQLTLIISGPQEAQLLLIELLFLVVVIMAFYRWGVVEDRLERRPDMRLGVGKYATYKKLPNDLKKYVICVGGTRARQLITKSVRRLLKEKGDNFELIVFHADVENDPAGFLPELLQKVVSQQVVGEFHRDFIIELKVLPGNLKEGLLTLTKKKKISEVYIGAFSKAPDKDFMAGIENELGLPVSPMVV